MGNYGITAAMLGKSVPYPNGSGGVGYAVPTLNGQNAGSPAGYVNSINGIAPGVNSVSPTADINQVTSARMGKKIGLPGPVLPTIGFSSNGKTLLGGG